MKCPFCSYTESKVIDSRPAEEGTTIRRRRECLACQKRFTTYEVIEHLPLVVVKRDGSRQSFDRNKVLNGMLRSCEKRPVSMSQLEAIADEIEQELQNSFEREIQHRPGGRDGHGASQKGGRVAYVRFASVYRQFQGHQPFMDSWPSSWGTRRRAKHTCPERASPSRQPLHAAQQSGIAARRAAPSSQRSPSRV
jgi:transcriptional repressor NrdR